MTLETFLDMLELEGGKRHLGPLQTGTTLHDKYLFLSMLVINLQNVKVSDTCLPHGVADSAGGPLPD